MNIYVNFALKFIKWENTEFSFVTFLKNMLYHEPKESISANHVILVAKEVK